MKAQILLELRKNRLLFIGLAGAFWLSLALASWGYGLAGKGAPQGLAAALAFWTLAGLPGMALLFGASGGASAADAPERDAEDLLPLSPGRRIAASLAADSVQLALLALLFLLTAFVLSPAWREFLVETVPSVVGWDTVEFKASDPTARAFFSLSPFLSVYVLLLGFLFAYASRNGVFGGMLALLVGGPAATVLVLGNTQRFMSIMSGWTSRLLLLGLPAAAALALVAAARWLLRREKPSPLGLAAVACALLAGPVLAPWIFRGRHLARQASLSRIYTYPFAPYDHDYGYLRPPAPAGAAFASIRGDIVWITPEGRRTTLRQGQTLGILRPLVDRGLNDWLRDMAFDEDGGLWALIVPPETAQAGSGPRGAEPWELWHGTLEEGLKPYGPAGAHTMAGFVHDGPALALGAWSKGASGRLFASLPPPGRAPEWKSVGAEMDALLARGWVERHEAAEVSKDGRSMRYTDSKGRSVSWSLPGKADVRAWVSRASPRHGLGGKAIFLVPVEPAKGRFALAVCAMDGRTRTVWPDSLEPELKTLPDGTVWSWGEKRELRVILPDGTLLPPADLRAALEASKIAFRTPRDLPKVLHREGRTAWLLAESHPGEALMMPQEVQAAMLKVDLDSGRLLELKPWRDMGAMETGKGLFFRRDGRLRFLSWSGEDKDLGAL